MPADQIAAAIAAYSPTAIFDTGDLVWNGPAEQYAECKNWLSQVGCERHYVLPGNHDTKTDALTEYDNHFTRRFSVERFGIRWIGFCAHERSIVEGEEVIDIVGDVTATELAWITEELSKATEDVIVLMSHFPLIDAFGGGHIDQNGAEILALMETYDVVAHLSGHQHQNLRKVIVSGRAHVNTNALWSGYVIGVVNAGSVTLTQYSDGAQIIVTF